MATEATGSGILQESLLRKLPKDLTLEFLKKITKDFSKDQELGTGALGTVYRGILEDGGEIAVKKHLPNAPGTHDKKKYEDTVRSLMEHEHENVVKLLAFCRKEGKINVPVKNSIKYVRQDVVESLLCYEYLPKGSLHKNLFGESAISIDWNKRFGIIKGICQGLQSLHTLPRPAGPIIHLNLKSQNILLDDNMLPKITDFAYSRLFGQEETRVKTQTSIGSSGYKAPEFVHRQEISARTDIYSLGLIILEITTKEKNSPAISEETATKFIKKVKGSWKDKVVIMSAYPDLDAASLGQLNKCITIGLKCVDLDENNRPTIVEIVDQLNSLW